MVTLLQQADIIQVIYWIYDLKTILNIITCEI